MLGLRMYTVQFRDPYGDIIIDELKNVHVIKQKQHYLACNLAYENSGPATPLTASHSGMYGVEWFQVVIFTCSTRYLNVIRIVAKSENVT